MNRVTRLLILTAIIICVPIILNFIGDNPCKKQKRINSTFIINGIVQKKYIDEPNHGHKTLEFRSFDNETLSMQFTTEMGGFYELIKVGDTVIKTSGTNKIRIKGQYDTLYALDYHCKPE